MNLTQFEMMFLVAALPVVSFGVGVVVGIWAALGGKRGRK